MSSSVLHNPATEEPQKSRSCQEFWFHTVDGTKLFYRAWAPVQPAAGAPLAIVLLHRGHEHSGRLQQLVDELELPGYWFFAWDSRGHGRSPGDRGDSPSMGTSVKDLDTFVAHLQAIHGLEITNMAVVAQSVGSVLAAAWVHDYAPKIRALVLAAPAFSVKLYVPFARLFLQAFYALRGNFFVSSYVKAKFLTHDPARIASYEADPLITRNISVRILLGLYETGDRLVSDAAAIVVPTQVLSSEKDWVVKKGPQLQFFQNLGSVQKEFHEFADFFHDTLGEKDRHLAIAKVRAFVLRQFENPTALPDLRTSHKEGFTFDEHTTLQRPLPALSFKNLNFASTRLFMRTLGKISDGIRLGVETGFDSGSTLDYVYRNQAKGFTPIGKIVDWFYLNAIGWRGIRIRRKNLEALLGQAVEALAQEGRKANLLDIAAGHGRYALAALAARKSQVASILLRDYSARNVEKGLRLIDEFGLSDVARFEQADAFNPALLQRMQTAPNVAIISGFFELFPDNGPVGRTLTALCGAMEEGGYLLYTGQPWHPQLEMIARTLSSHRDGKPWVMRRRTQAELDQLVEAAGFTKVTQLTDDWGIFTVSLARKVRR